MPYGYAGKILRVNLSTSEIAVEEPDGLFYRKYMGGMSAQEFPQAGNCMNWALGGWPMNYAAMACSRRRFGGDETANGKRYLRVGGLGS
jgi:hypothetical protein